MKVGRYEILETIGTGANGSVVRAHDPMIGRLGSHQVATPGIGKGRGAEPFSAGSACGGAIIAPLHHYAA